MWIAPFLSFSLTPLDFRKPWKWLHFWQVLLPSQALWIYSHYWIAVNIFSFIQNFLKDTYMLCSIWQCVMLSFLAFCEEPFNLHKRKATTEGCTVTETAKIKTFLFQVQTNTKKISASARCIAMHLLKYFNMYLPTSLVHFKELILLLTQNKNSFTFSNHLRILVIFILQPTSSWCLNCPR